LKKILFTLLVLLSSLYATVTNEYASQKLIDNNTPIVDIRTSSEWIETGLFKGAIPIMFFDERGAYDIKGFLTELNAKVDTTKTFAIICRTGSRTRMLSSFLSKDLGYNVINIQGGMVYAKSKNLPILPYKK
jgi:rhodanese-related sulfurtransferase